MSDLIHKFKTEFNEAFDRAESAAAASVLQERHRQITAEGWTYQHDDEHDKGELAEAAACYAVAVEGDPVRGEWPFNDDAWKPRDKRSNLVRAGALILAEIERLDRAASKIGGGR